MGLQTEFNWYLVLEGKNFSCRDDEADFEDREISLVHTYHVNKKDYRVYPMDTPLPLIYNGKCLGLAMVQSLQWSDNVTHLVIRPILNFNKHEILAQYYEDSFKQYKQQQESINDGGKIDLRNIVNPMNRVRV